MKISKTRKGKRFLAAFLSLVLVIGSLVITPISAKADTYVDYSSANATWHVEYENGDIVLHMYDKGRDPNAVIGFKITGV